VIVIGLETPRSAGENFGCTWEQLEVPATCLGAPMARLISLGRASDKAGCANYKPGRTWKHQHQLWEHLKL